MFQIVKKINDLFSCEAFLHGFFFRKLAELHKNPIEAPFCKIFVFNHAMAQVFGKPIVVKRLPVVPNLTKEATNNVVQGFISSVAGFVDMVFGWIEMPEILAATYNWPHKQKKILFGNRIFKLVILVHPVVTGGQIIYFSHVFVLVVRAGLEPARWSYLDIAYQTT